MGEAERALLRMAKAYRKGKGVRLSNEDLWFLDKTFLGEVWVQLEENERTKHPT